VRNLLTFYSQFRKRYHTTGSVIPSSRFLASAITGPLSRREGPRRVLEVGPGTGAFTQRIVRLLRPDDHFDVVEINPAFAEFIRQEFESNPDYRAVAGISAVHEVPLQEFEFEKPYDIIISGLPTTNFDVPLVEEIFRRFMELLAEGGELSYFEYMYLRDLRKFIDKKANRLRFREMDRAIAPYHKRYRTHRSWVFLNFPAAWVHHLKKPASEASQPPRP
jgi:phospholipid N-methyltransferase